MGGGIEFVKCTREPMGTRSSGSSSIAQRRRCPCCHVKNIVELTATTYANRGRIFFTCPNHEKDGSGCNFWYWEDGYVKYLERKGYIAEKELTDVKQMSVRKKAVNNKDGEEDEVKKIMLSIVSIGLEIVQILKGMLVGFILVVLALVCLVLAVWLK
uniref:GRF-type domain-containing protein n=1 Tax=Oryza meridionalis TaxID=40149 RepID=A0A0E0FAL7_9ORYZ